jgi:hypothetical protein
VIISAVWPTGTDHCAAPRTVTARCCGGGYRRRRIAEQASDAGRQLQIRGRLARADASELQVQRCCCRAQCTRHAVPWLPTAGPSQPLGARATATRPRTAFSSSSTGTSAFCQNRFALGSTPVFRLQHQGTRSRAEQTLSRTSLAMLQVLVLRRALVLRCIRSHIPARCPGGGRTADYSRMMGAGRVRLPRSTAAGTLRV